MSRESGARASESREKKKAQFSESARSKSNLTPILAGVFLILAAVAAYMVIGRSSDTPDSTAIPAAQQAGASADIRVPVSELGDGKARFFDYTLPGNKSIRFFVIKSSDGVYRAALDACDTCYHAKKGYHQEGDDMVCNKCGLRFHTSLINQVSGGCNPVGLPRTVEGEQLVIKKSDLQIGDRYF